MVSVEKYIAPETTTGPAWSAATSGSMYVQICRMLVTFDRLISASGEKRSPASVRLYEGQSAAGTGASDAAGAGVMLVCAQPRVHRVATMPTVNRVSRRSVIRVAGKCRLTA